MQTFWLMWTQCWPKMFDELHPQFRSKTSWKSIPFKSRLNSYHWLQLFIIIIVEHSGLKKAQVHVFENMNKPFLKVNTIKEHLNHEILKVEWVGPKNISPFDYLICKYCW
jgi:hypothetical protein